MEGFDIAKATAEDFEKIFTTLKEHEKALETAEVNKRVLMGEISRLEKVNADLITKNTDIKTENDLLAAKLRAAEETINLQKANSKEAE